MGFKYGVVYNSSSNFFRQHYFYLKCGRGTPCMYYGPEAAVWFRFKTVRNPYVRAVSSYLFMLSHLTLFQSVSPFFQCSTVSMFIKQQYLAVFSGFSNKFCVFWFLFILWVLKRLSNLTTLQLQYYAHSHAGIQSKPYERHFYYASGNKTSIFHEILYLEHPEEGIKRLNKATGMNFTINEQFKHSSKDKIVNSTYLLSGIYHGLC
jgi:hypothetical protein